MARCARRCDLMARRDSIADQRTPVIRHPIDLPHFQVLVAHVLVLELLSTVDTLRVLLPHSAKCHHPPLPHWFLAGDLSFEIQHPNPPPLDLHPH